MLEYTKIPCNDRKMISENKKERRFMLFLKISHWLPDIILRDL